MNMAIQTDKLEIGQFVDFVAVDKPIDIAPTQACRWLVLLTEPNREFTTTANLMLRKVPFYVPTYTKAGRLPLRLHRAGKTHPEVVRPIFAGMVFVPQIVVEANEDLVRSAYGVVSSHPFMRFGDEIAIIRPEVMEIIHGVELTERERYLASKGRRGIRFQVGDEVRAAVGELLGGRGGTIEHIDDHGRITLLMEIFKRKVRVHLTQDQVEAL